MKMVVLIKYVLISVLLGFFLVFHIEINNELFLFLVTVKVILILIYFKKLNLHRVVINKKVIRINIVSVILMIWISSVFIQSFYETEDVKYLVLTYAIIVDNLMLLKGDEGSLGERKSDI